MNLTVEQKLTYVLVVHPMCLVVLKSKVIKKLRKNSNVPLTGFYTSALVKKFQKLCPLAFGSIDNVITKQHVGNFFLYCIDLIYYHEKSCCFRPPRSPVKRKVEIGWTEPRLDLFDNKDKIKKI